MKNKIATFTVTLYAPENASPEMIDDFLMEMLPAMNRQLLAATTHFTGKGFVSAEIDCQIEQI
jgi:hypothetical protein